MSFLLWTGEISLAVYVPDWIVWPLPLLSAIVAAERIVGESYVRRKNLRQRSLTAFRVQEAAGIFVVLLIVFLFTRLVFGGSEAFGRLIGAFLNSPAALLDRTTVIWIVVLAIAWYLPGPPWRAAELLKPQQGELGPEPTSPGYDEWLHSPARHFDHRRFFERFLGVFVGGLGIEAILVGSVWATAPGTFESLLAGLAAIATCVCGVMAVTFAHRRLRETWWRVELLEFNRDETWSWARLGGGLIGLLLIVALLIPAVILIDIIRLIIGAALLLVVGIFSLLSLTVPPWITSRTPQTPLRPPPLPQSAATTASHAAGPALPAWLPSALIAAVIVAVAVVVLARMARSAARYRGAVPSHLAALSRLLREAAAALRRLLVRTRRAAAVVARALRRVPRTIVSRPFSPDGSRRPKTDREAVRAAFRELVREGADAGFPRAPGQTAREYARELEYRVPETSESVAQLQELFDVASYAPRPIDASMPERARRLYRSAQHALSAWLKRGQETAPPP